MERDVKTANTDLLLKEIAKHLSTRRECKGVEYRLEISANSIRFEPDIQVFPNRYIKCKGSEHSVIYHILMTVFNQLDENTEIFVEGVYRYVKPYNSKKRNWLRSNKDED